MKSIIIQGLFTLIAFQAQAQSIAPTATYTDANGNEVEETAITGSAPLTVTFHANPEEVNGWNAFYEWRFYHDKDMTTPYLIRHEEETTLQFNDAGTHKIQLWATFVQGDDTVSYRDDYYNSGGTTITVSISESRLEMPNAFSPNGDGINDVYKAKSGYQSIVSFKATIYNRWGQKLYEWTDPAGGWDGRSHGKDVPQGVYFVQVEAKGADGRDYHIRRDVNLLRGFTERQGAVSTE